MNEQKLQVEEPNYAKVVKLHFGASLGLLEMIVKGIVDFLIKMLTYTFSEASKSTLEMASYLVLFVAPIPNSTTVFKSMSKAGYGTGSSWAGAIAIEVVLFFIIEGALVMLEGYIKDPKRYKILLYVMVGAVLVGTVSVIGLVAYLEVAEGGFVGFAVLPVFSLLAFITMASLRWKGRHDESEAKEKEQKRADRMQRKVGFAPVKSVAKPIPTDSKTDSTGAGQSVKQNDYRGLQLAMLPIYQAEPTKSISSVAAQIGSNKTAVRNALLELETMGVVEIVKLGKGQQVTVNGKYEQFMSGSLTD